MLLHFALVPWVLNRTSTGIFDLAGGVWEFTHSNRSQVDNITPTWASSGLNAGNFNFNRFGDVLYLNQDFLNCQNCPDWQPIAFGSFLELYRYFGSATHEITGMNPGVPTEGRSAWGGDYSGSPSPTVPWFIRGGHSANAGGAGALSFTWYTGGAHTRIGFRPIIAGS